MIINITSQNTTDLLTNIGGLVTDLMPLILLILGIKLAFLIVRYILGVVQEKYYEKNPWTRPDDYYDE
jgi:uncharacterized membrane protein